MKYNPIEEEKKWWVGEKCGKGQDKPLPPRHQFAHNQVRLKIYDTLAGLGCHSVSSVLEVGCGSGEDAVHVSKVSQNIVGVDVSNVALKAFCAKGFSGVLADVRSLPFQDGCFDYVVASALLHHLVGQANLEDYLVEFTRVTRRGGHVIVMEPNVFNLSGLAMNVFQRIKPGVTGLVPHERALSPLYLTKLFNGVGLKEVRCVAASYVWNRFPLFISRFIARHEQKIRFRKPFNLFGWFEIVYGRKTNIEGIVK